MALDLYTIHTQRKKIGFDALKWNNTHTYSETQRKNN